MTPEPTGQQDLRAYLRILWRWKFLFLALLVMITSAAYLIERGKPKIYQSSTLVQLQSATPGTGSFEVPGNLLAVARLVTTRPVATAAALFLHPPASPDALLGAVSASPDPDSGFLTISAQDHDPNRAAAIANAFAAALANHQTQQATAAIDEQLRALGNQLAATAKNDQAARVPLTQQISQLQALRGSAGAGAQVVESAVASGTPIGPKTRRAVELAFVIALLVGIGAVLAAESSDRRLRTPEDLEELTGMPLLGTIPRSAFSLGHDEPTPRDNEAFQMLRASLTYFNVDRPLKSVAMISPVAEDGKTTVAVGLAVASARAGRRVILVDADLRRPQVCTRLGIAPTAGLGAVLAKERPLSEVLVSHDVDAPAGGSLLVLPAGPPPPNPSALISSEEMRALLRQLEGQCDMVIIDTAAALAVSDALPLLHAASGVVMIVRMNRSSRAAVRRLQKVIASTHGEVMGLVATGTGSAAGYDSYGYYYGEEQKRGRRGLRGRRRSGVRADPSGTPGAGASEQQPAPGAPTSAAPNGVTSATSQPTATP